MTWQMQEAETKFGELMQASVQEGPQVVVEHGKEIAVVVSMDQWKLIEARKPTLKEVLLYESPKIDDMMIPERGTYRYRTPPKF